MDGFDPHDGSRFPACVKLPAEGVTNMYSSSQQWTNVALPALPQQHKGKLARIKFPRIAYFDIGGGYDPLEDEYLFLKSPGD